MVRVADWAWNEEIEGETLQTASLFRGRKGELLMIGTVKGPEEKMPNRM